MNNVITDKFISKYKNKQPNWGFNGLGYIVYKRTYARLKENGETEEWYETVQRCINGAQEIGAGYTQEEAERLYDLIFNLKCNLAGRMLWQLGTPTVKRWGANSLLNCLGGQTKVLTRQGWKEIHTLVDKSVEIVTKNGKWVIAPFKSYGKQSLMKVTFEDKYGNTEEILATPNHRWFYLDKNHNLIDTTTLGLKVGQKIPVIRGKNSSDEISPQDIQYGLVDRNYNNYTKVKNVETTDLIEEVYCAEVPDTHSFVIQGNILTGNCWAVAMREPKAFLFLFENLMLGGGVGFSIRREDVHELPKIKVGVDIIHQNTKDADFIVPDSREGWVKLLENLLNAFYVTGKSFNYSTILIRGSGELIRGFGGKASGPAILVSGIDKISTIFRNREGKKLRSIDVLDICNIIGSIVVAGNVRRCLPSTYLVSTKLGDIPISEIKIGDMIETNGEYKPVTNVYNQGKQLVDTIKTVDGESFSATKNHKLLIYNKVEGMIWKKVSDINKETDFLVKPKKK